MVQGSKKPVVLPITMALTLLQSASYKHGLSQDSFFPQSILQYKRIERTTAAAVAVQTKVRLVQHLLSVKTAKTTLFAY